MTMEFPSNAWTNVHRINGILFIQWQVYVWDSKVQTSSESGSRTRDGHTLSNEGVELHIASLLAAEEELRKEGQHVLSEPHQAALWIFDLSGPGSMKDLKYGEKPLPQRILERYPCKRPSFGSLKASDLAETLASTTQDASANKDMSLLRFSQGRLSTVSQHITQDHLSIYRRIVSAISMSLTYRLAKTRKIIPLVLDQVLEVSSTRPTCQSAACPLNTLSSIAINVQWLPSGSILISTCPSNVSAWCSVADLEDQKIDSVDEYLTEPLKLSPIGKLASYKRDVPEQISPKWKRTESLLQNGVQANPDCEAWKVSVASLLRCYGLEIDASTRWIPVQVFEPVSLVGPAPRETFLHQHDILWPAHLCFVRCDEVPRPGRDFSWAWDDGDDEAADPLVDAETWFKGKADREQALEAYHQRKEKEAQKRLPSPSDDGDSMPDLFSISQRRIDQQALSGIYPTPPDGFRAQAVGHPSDLGKDTRDRVDAEGLSGVKMEEQTPGDVFESERVSPDVEMNVEDYHRLDGDDLFGDMNTDMFTAHGLTEDDFDFFDQPAESELMPSTETAATQDSSAKDSLLQASEASEQVDQDIDMLMDEPSFVNDVQSNGQMGHQQTFKELSWDTPDEPKQPAIREKSQDTRKRARDEDQEDSHDSNGALSSSASSLEDNSSLRFGGYRIKQTVPFHDKYTQQGRFAIDIPNTPAGDGPTKPSTQGNVLPRLGLLEERKAIEVLDYEDDSGSTSSAEDEITGLTRTFGSFGGASADAEDCMEEDDDGSKSDNATLRELVKAPLPTIRTILVCLDDTSLAVPRNAPLFTHKTLVDVEGDRAPVFIQVAQLVAYQLPLRLESSESCEYSNSLDSFISEGYLPSFQDPLQPIFQSLFPRGESCDLRICTTLGDQLSTSASTPKPIARSNARLLSIGSQNPYVEVAFSIPPSRMLVQRTENSMEISSAALHFWEELGLGPCSGPKNVRAFCVFPVSHMIQRAAENFLQTISGTYQSFRLGNHSVGDELEDFSDGLVPVKFEGDSMEDNMKRMDEACEQLGEQLWSQSDFQEYIVVYMVNPCDDIAAIPHLCAAFAKITNEPTGDDNDSAPLDHGFALKIIPIEILASQTTVPLPPPTVYAQLAKEVYDRCRPQASIHPPYESLSLFQLAEDVPKTIEFHTEFSPPVIPSANMSYHLAYSWEMSGEWLAAAITDRRGRLQWNASYCLGTAPNLWSRFYPIAKEIWEILFDILGPCRTSCQLYVVKDGTMAEQEIKAWTTLSSAAGSRLAVDLVLATIDPYPSLHFTGTPELPTSPVKESGSYVTPATTPLPTTGVFDVSSPVFNYGTPPSKPIEGLENDPNAKLIVKSDEAWGVISAYVPSQDLQASTSGYLVKRAGAHDSDGLICMGVQIAQADRAVLKDLLCQYRDLGTIAKARGVTDPVQSVLPWHMAVARNARRGLNRTMQWLDVEP